MSEHSTPEQRTEMPTERRIGQLRREGQMHLSNEVVTVVSLITGFYAVTLVWGYLYKDCQAVLKYSFGMIVNARDINLTSLRTIFFDLLSMIGPRLLIIIALISTASVLTTMLQTNWCVKEKKLHFRFHMLNPINGLKRIISIQGVVNTLKAIIKLSLILPIAYFALKKFAPEMVRLIHMSIESVFVYTGASMHALFWKIAYILIALAIFDYFWSRHQWLKSNKMTKEEVKDERKSIEGDEATKRKIIHKGLQRIMQRIANTVPKADVVVTNPTHYAVALKYDRKTMSAPVVVAKGKGFLALRIREIAKNSGVPVLERKPLARALFASTEVGTEIPHGLFRAVAEVLAYVYKLKNPHGYNAAGQK